MNVLSSRSTQKGLCHATSCLEKDQVTWFLWGEPMCLCWKRIQYIRLWLYRSVGTAVQARLWEVPAVICWIDTPSKPSTFLGLVMGVEVWPCPHWPMVLFPQAYTSFSDETRAAHLTVRAHSQFQHPVYNDKKNILGSFIIWETVC